VPRKNLGKTIEKNPDILTTVFYPEIMAFLGDTGEKNLMRTQLE
jgi:hypothetical protein